MSNYKLELKIALICRSNLHFVQKRATKLSQRLRIPLLPQYKAGEYDFNLILSEKGLGIKYQDSRESLEYRPEWEMIDTNSGYGRSKKQPLIKALLGKRGFVDRPLVIDCTAGFGQDTWIMASLGFYVVAVEKNKIVFALFQDAWSRAGVNNPEKVRRIKPINQDFLELQKQVGSKHNAQLTKQTNLPQADIVYLDPMFPEAAGRKAAEKKQMKILRKLLVQDEEQNEEIFLSAALEHARKRVVVKRKRNSSLFAKGLINPVHQVQGKGFRYDIYSKKF